METVEEELFDPQEHRKCGELRERACVGS
jgi:hypothetical protein